MKRFLLKEWAKTKSKRTWIRLSLTYRTNGLKTGETTITENLIFDFFKLSSLITMPVQLFEATNEPSNGNDIEIAIETNKGYILFPCQAKKLNDRGRYDGMLKSRDKPIGDKQIDHLINYATLHEGIPIYLLYNGKIDDKTIKPIQKVIKFNIDKFGCSVSAAIDLRNNFVNRNIVPRFENIHPTLAIPFYKLFDLLYKSVLDVDGLKLLFDKKMPIKYYSKSELVKDMKWEDLSSRFSLGEPSKRHESQSESDDEHDGFWPRYRIVLSRNLFSYRKGKS